MLCYETKYFSSLEGMLGRSADYGTTHCNLESVFVRNKKLLSLNMTWWGTHTVIFTN